MAELITIKQLLKETDVNKIFGLLKEKKGAGHYMKVFEFDEDGNRKD